MMMFRLFLLWSILHGAAFAEGTVPAAETAAAPAESEVSAPPAVPGAPVATARIGKLEIDADILKLRDPFKRPSPQTEGEEPKTDLELFPVDQLRLVGVVTGPDRVRAMVSAPNGRTYVVAEKTKVGVRKGIVKAISAERVVISERFVNVLGQEEQLDTELKLPSRRGT